MLQRVRIATGTAAVICFICGLASMPAGAAAAELESLAGDWTLAFESPSGPARLANLAVSKRDDGSGLAAKMKSQLGEAEINDIKLDGGTHVLSYSMQRGQQAVSLQMLLKVEGDKLAGELQVGQGITMPVKGAKAGSESEKALKAAIETTNAKPAAEPTLAFADVGEFAGEWTLVVESDQSGTQRADFAIKDQNGKAVGKLMMPPPIGEQTMTDISKTESGLDLRYEVDFGSQKFKVTLALELKNDRLTGKMADDNNLFELPVRGVRKGQEASDPALVGAQGGAGQQRRTRERGQTAATVTLGSGKKITVSYGQPSTTDAGVNRIPFQQREGFIWQMGKEFATKMRTDAALRVGDQIVKPGRYSLWARRTVDGWVFVVNERPDIYGTQHDPAADVAEIPFTAAKLAETVEKLTIALAEENGTIVLKLSWGDDELRAEFKELVAIF